MKKRWFLLFFYLFLFAKVYSQVQETKRYTVEFYPLKGKDFNFRLQVTRNFGDAFSLLFSGGTKLNALDIDTNSYRIHTNSSNHVRIILDDFGGGFRIFLYKKLHFESQIWLYYEMLKSFEADPFFHYFEISIPIRLGYIFDFKLMQYDAFVNLQAEFNTSIYRAFLIDDDISLESFEKKYKIIFPVVSLGIRL